MEFAADLRINKSRPRPVKSGMQAVAISCVFLANISTAAWAQTPAPDTSGFFSNLDAALGGMSTPGLVQDNSELYLAVFINDRDTRLLGKFEFDPASRLLSAAAKELRELGVRPPDDMDGMLLLNSIPGVAYRYDPNAQTVFFTLSASAMMPFILSAQPIDDFQKPESSFGAVLNYRLTANMGNNIFDDGLKLNEVYATLDGRIYTPFGVLTNTGSLSFDIDGSYSNFRRHETRFSYSAPNSMISYTVGDFVGAGVAWARTIRMGGLQVRRDFSLRSNIVTTPLLSYSGVAAVPSTVDVYIDNLRAFSGAVEAGPFVLTDVPLINNQGEAQIVLRDEAGTESVVVVPFFASRNLLRAGLLDFALQAGYPREGEDYADDWAASGSLRYGVTDSLTVEGYLEGNSELLMGGLGLNAVVSNFAEVNLAGGMSSFRDTKGGFIQAGVRGNVLGAEVSVSSYRSFGDFADLAYVTGLDVLDESDPNPTLAYLLPAHQKDIVSIGLPAFADGKNLWLNFINSKRGSTTDQLLSVSYSQPVGTKGSSLRINAFRSFGDDSGFGLSAFFSMRLGSSHHASVGISHDSVGGFSNSAYLSHLIDDQIGSTGYAISMTGIGQNRYTDMQVAQNTRFGRAEMRVTENAGKIGVDAIFEGALVVAGGGIFATPVIRDAFAVVDVGFSGVGVNIENRQVTQTGQSGFAIVTGLQSYRQNRISLNVDDIPVGASIDVTGMTVVPARYSGVTLRFGATEGDSALVTLYDANGAHIPPGTVGKVNNLEEGFIVGYDGLIWITGLQRSNTLTIKTATMTCSASFGFVPVKGEQVRIDPVECL